MNILDSSLPVRDPTIEKPPERRTSRLAELKTATVFFITLLISGCVYHKRDSNRPHILQYDHRDAEVVYPWRASIEFKKEYELAIIASISIWFAYPAELIDGLSSMNVKKMFSLLPAIIYAHENDRERVRSVTESSQQQRNQRENQRRHQIRKEELARER
jgi:hypothetical protein